jgi:hypothetical protein
MRTLRNQTLMDRGDQQSDERMDNPMEKAVKVLGMLHIRIQSAKLIQDTPLGIATFALDH